MLRASVQISVLVCFLLPGCHLIFPFEIEAQDDLGAVGDNGRPQADAPVDDRTTVPGESLLSDSVFGETDPSPDMAPAKDIAPPDDTVPSKDTKPTQDSQSANDSTPDPACTPSCTGGETCCDKGTGYDCFPSADQCHCDPATKKPCSGPHPICCDRATGKGFICYGIAQACLCDPSTGQPCESPYAYCCNKGFGDKCYSSCP